MALGGLSSSARKIAAVTLTAAAYLVLLRSRRRRKQKLFPAGKECSSNEEGRGLAAAVCEVLLDYLRTQTLKPVVRLAGPSELSAAFATRGCGLELFDGDPGVSDAVLVEAIRLTLEYSPRTGGPLFFNQLYGRAEVSSVVGDWVATALNGNVHTFEVAPCVTLMERSVIRKIARFVGPAFAESEEGLLVPGGSIGNLYALHLARERCDPLMATRGSSGSERFVLFVSADAHYSYLKSARLVGIGTDNVVLVGIREPDGGMDPLLLKEAISREKQRGGRAFMVGATAGTTVRGAFDPLEEIAQICASEEIWLHVDAAWGGAALFSERHRANLKGVHLADSFSWSLHKLLGVALQCAVFLTKHKGSLERANATRAAYLFQKDKLHADLDIGDRTIQCGRKPDALKAWLYFKSMGDAGCAASVDHAFGLAEYAVQQIRASDAFMLTYEPSCTNVCFWFLPTNMRGSHKRRSSALHRVAPRIKAILQTRGAAMLGFQSVGGQPNFFRWVFASTQSCVTKDHVDHILKLIRDIGDTLEEHDEDYLPRDDDNDTHR